LFANVLHRDCSWFADLEAIRAAGISYLDSLRRNTRQQIRRSLRLYEKDGALTGTNASSLEEALLFLDELAALHQASWTRRRKRGAFASPYFRKFHQALIRTAW